MKYIIFILTFLTIKGQCQVYSIKFEARRKILNTHNSFQVLRDGKIQDSLLVITDNGKVTYEYGSYCVFPDKLGDLNLSIYKIKARDTVLVLRKLLQVETFKDFTYGVFASTSSGGTIRKERLPAQCCIFAKAQNVNMNATLAIVKFKVEIIRNGEIIHEIMSNSNKLSSETQLAFQNIKAGDIINFTNIMVVNPDIEHTKFILKPLTYFIK